VRIFLANSLAIKVRILYSLFLLNVILFDKVIILTMNLLPIFKKPYYAVIFSSQRKTVNQENYELMTERMMELAKEQKGFLGVESVRGLDGLGITISYWESENDIQSWKANGEHRTAQELGRNQWYESFVSRICKVEREYGHSK
jgi:heme-degrading monooxygenase HmoA